LRERRNFSLNLGWILAADENRIDEVLIGIMRAPHSYTGEDVVEINCHGGGAALRACLQRCLDLGARLAEPGEFTKRAFLNDRLALEQAEAVLEIIRAKTERGLQLAVKQLSGRTGRFIAELEDRLLGLNAMVDASLDFPDEVGDLDQEEARMILMETIGTIDSWLGAARRAEIYRDGIELAIVGKPNVGKSSLLNALSRKEKAIVTDIPGTTRDIVEEFINVRGIPVKLMDTAGIRATEDLVEKIGVEKARELISQADLVVLVLDFEAGIAGEDMEIFQHIPAEKRLVLVNKEDIERKAISEEELADKFSSARVIRASIKEDYGLDELENAIEELLLPGTQKADGLEIMVNMRQKYALLKSRDFAENALQQIGVVSLDCLGVDVWGALESLGEISGRSLKEEVLDRIFHDFCIGK
ncbi:MAG TPA: tRNA uridine-5-carboxymethylaminomethyl(34) synthesis GTPase MnmE, partial [Syntrophomonas sp.]|nr:tRNA uridine-5-carboxymethylaminomethyl(34) synthesis GTPase MnmE [Syntrophomonas sp.]